VLGGDSDYVPKSGADESNEGRRLLWSNIGAPQNIGGHSGWLSLARELSVSVDSACTGARLPRLHTSFVPELSKLRLLSSASKVSGTVSTLLSEKTGSAQLERVGDTLLLPSLGARQMEVRLSVRASVVGGSDAYGAAINCGVSDDGKSLLETTRIGYAPHYGSFFIDRSRTSLNGSDAAMDQQPPADSANRKLLQ
jgi:hypothetical protein